jgi:1,2-phenylacetyl-CoA epoxidase catalytic subunit
VKTDDVAVATLPWSDDLFLHHHQLVRWVTDYVDLEESLAIASVSQEELAHANVLLEQAGCTVEERDWRIFLRDVGEWAPSRLAVWPVEDWPTTVARGFLLTEASLVLVAELQRRGTESLQDAATVVEAEQQLHARHWRRWVDILEGDPDTTEGFRADLAQAAARCDDLFGFAIGSAVLDAQALHRAFHAAVETQLAELGISGPPLPREAVGRKPGTATPELARHLSRVRQVRAANPDWVYGIYR